MTIACARFMKVSAKPVFERVATCCSSIAGPKVMLIDCPNSSLIWSTAEIDLITLPDSTAGSIAAKRMTNTIPVVFGMSGDPIQLGLVASWNRPGGNFTGIVLGNTELVAKRMDLLHQLAPVAKNVGLLVNQENSGAADIKSGQQAARALGLGLRVLNATNQDEIRTAIESLAEEEGRALLVGSDTLFYVHREWMTRLAAQHRLIAVYDRREYVLAGGLMSYGANLLAFHRQVGVYVGRSLRGEKPSTIVLGTVCQRNSKWRSTSRSQRHST